MLEFYQALRVVPLASIRHHLERTTPVGATPDRAEILSHVEDHYLIQEQTEGV